MNRARLTRAAYDHTVFAACWKSMCFNARSQIVCDISVNFYGLILHGNISISVNSSTSNSVIKKTSLYLGNAVQTPSRR